MAQSEKSLTDDEKNILKLQDMRLVSEHRANQLETDSKKYWDLFYKRNTTKFFKDRHWSTREFQELLNSPSTTTKRTLLEIGCGVGNFVFPLLEEHLNFYIFACDLSPRAVDFVKSHSLYNETAIKAFQTDITTESISEEVEDCSVDVITLIFVLSAIHPDKYVPTLRRIFKLLRPGGIVLFRDYGLYDMAQLRFKPGNKIADNFYMRQDGTRSYYFAREMAEQMFTEAGFKIVENNYIHRRTVNKKENVDVPRIFLQAKLLRPDED